MYKVIILAVAITAIAAEYQDASTTPCKPGAMFNVDCNRCVCNRFGSGAACTKMACAPIGKRSVDDIDNTVFPENASCEAGKPFKYYCNQCSCNSNGEGAACTKMACPPGLFNKDGSMNIPIPPREKRQTLEELPADGTCVAGRAYRSDCNSCQCLENNQAICTLRACASRVESTRKRRQAEDEERWGPVYTQGTECKPNTHFFSECNQCQCLMDGRSAACTFMACP